MSNALFFVTDTNPNDNTGGGGCVCSPMKQVDCQPPYVVFPGNDMENISSPNVVICALCIDAADAALIGERLGAGEPSTIMDAEPIDADGWDD